ncbi:hypothetical protein C9374_005049 [Naegleria lovaniensis]|uniref:Copper acquisition factor BIM1-like domain-containing protein n=1 Tax=Naegleria lovaniensis TaxID=51637 RepID=A0AA88GK67_NAELO|nr:uncharacterized protein C9374_005049 [Naegleria lovaniensis]KAG2382469.1 hypothetical protein C9374_005049 [Naegleria lovaniensis]
MRSLILAAVLVLSFVAFVYGHGEFILPRPRTFGISGSDTQKTGPCGSIAKKAPTIKYKGNQKTNVTWFIRANHGGSITMNIIDFSDKSTSVLVSGVRSASGNTTVSVTIPDKFCNNCTLQWVWRPNGESPYYGCVDISIDGAPINTTNNNNANNNNNNNNNNKANVGSLSTLPSYYSMIVGCVVVMLISVLVQF